MRSLKALAAGTLLVSAAVSNTNAAPITFDLNHPDSRNGIYSSSYALQYNYAEDDLALSLTGWSYGTTTSSYQVCTKTNKHNKCTKYATIETTSVNESIEQDYVGRWDGLGIEKTDSPNHGVDNEGGDYDMHLLAFDEIVKLTTLNIGWHQNDSDMSILAFTGSVFDSSSLLGKKWQDLLTDGWSVVGNYYNVDNAGNSGAVNQDGLLSRYWLVGAYNTSFGDIFSGPNLNRSGGDDFFKLKGLTVERQPPSEVVDVAEPGTVLLLGAAVLGLAITRRRTSIR
jgi:hypothetical protein